MARHASCRSRLTTSLPSLPKALRLPWLRAFRAFRPRAASPRWVGVARTPPPWLLPPPLALSAATSTPMWMAFIPPTRASATRRASWTRSPLRKCSNWPRWVPRSCRPARSSLPCATRCACGCCPHSRIRMRLLELWSATRTKSWNRKLFLASPTAATRRR